MKDFHYYLFRQQSGGEMEIIMKKKRIKQLCLSTTLALGTILCVENCYAYQFLEDTNYMFRNPADVSFYIEHDYDYYDTYAPLIKEYVPKWNINSEIKAYFKDSASANVHFYFSTLDNGLYGECDALNKSRRNINLYRAWFKTDLTKKAETVVHEMGHAFGLAHTQSYNDSISVMREFGFNNKPYPLEDDRNAIAALTNGGYREFPEKQLRKEKNIPAKTDVFNSLEEMEKYSPIIIKGRKMIEEEPSYEFNKKGEIITSYTLSKVEVEEIIKDDANELDIGKNISILENEALNIMTQQIEHRANYKKTETDKEYYLFIYKASNGEWYIPSGVTFGKIPIDENEEMLYKENSKRDSALYPQEKIAKEVYEKYK